MEAGADRVVSGSSAAGSLAVAAERARPVALAGERLVPVLPVLQPLLPHGALQRGTTLAVSGNAACSLALATVAGASAAGSWVAMVGLPSLGLAAAAEMGVALERLLLVAQPPLREWGMVMATLIDGVDIVVVRLASSVRAGDARRLQARVRQRGSVLVVIGGGGPLEADVRWTTTVEGWVGLDDGAGHLQGRRVVVEAGGRRAAARARRVALWLPDSEGGVRADDSGTVVALRGTA
jgi:hypothetical protein